MTKDVKQMLNRFIDLTIQHNAIDDYAEGITDKEYLEMEKLEKQIILDLEIAKQIKFDEDQMGRSLVDVQNWLSQEGKKNTEVIHHYLNYLLTTKKEKNQ